jgi:hypothetical protein
MGFANPPVVCITEMSETTTQEQAAPRAPMTVHAVTRQGALIAIHRSVKAASVDAWTRALNDPVTVKYAVQAWELGAAKPKSAWRVDSVRAAKASGDGCVALWLSELADDNRVPRQLWNSYMPLVVSDDH